MRLLATPVTGWILLGSVALLTSTASARTYDLKVGHPQIKGKRIHAHTGRWSMKAKSGKKWVENAIVQESTERRKIDGKEVIQRTQKIDMIDGTGVVDTCLLDGKTLAPIRYTRDLKLPEGAQLPPGMAVHTEWTFEDRGFRKIERSQKGITKTATTELPAPMFDLNVFGLVVAALPLKAGYSAVLPVAMDGGGPGQCVATQYKVKATVAGKERVTVRGKEVEAWRVDTEWADYATGAVSSPAGPESSGGAYWITVRRKDDLPHVLRYKNDTTDIDIAPAP